MQLRVVIFCVLVSAAGVLPVSAQSAQDLVRTHRYTEAIEQLGPEASGAEAFMLGQAHMRRGYALRDLARLHVRLGAAYYTGRQENEEARSTPWTAYYAARYRAALNPTGDAVQALRELVQSGNLPEGYAPRARVWIQRGQYASGGATWPDVSGASPAVQADLALARWQVGAGLPPLNCGNGDTPAAQRCALWAAVRAENWAGVVRIQKDLIRTTRPVDKVATIEDYSVRYYDPGTLWALAAADFRAAAAAYQRVTGQRKSQATLLAGICALQGRDNETARQLLDKAPSSPLRKIYRAVLAQETGNETRATRLFREAQQSNRPTLQAVWAEAAAPYAAQQKAVRSHCKTTAAEPPKDRRQALRLGRAALTVNRPQAALTLLDAAYPATQNNNVQAIGPAYLATYAHAKVAVERKYANEVLGHLNALRETIPVTSLVYDVAQGHYVPERRSGRVR